MADERKAQSNDAHRLIDVVPIAKLKPHPRNARTHSRKQISQIAASIRRFGFCNPVLVDDDNQIIAGHGRVEAARQLGMTAVPVLRLSHLSADEKRAYVLADNKLAEQAGWDREILAVELQGLIDLDFDVELTGFEAAEVDIILQAGDEPTVSRRPAKGRRTKSSEGPNVARRGDMWLLGEHRVLCGNALDEASLHRVVGGEKDEMLVIHCPEAAEDALADHLSIVFRLLDSSKDGARGIGVVIDPSLGWATTLIAAQRAGRCARGIESDPACVDAAIAEWQARTGKAATLAATEQTFAEVKAVRISPSLPTPETAKRGAAQDEEVR